MCSSHSIIWFFNWECECHAGYYNSSYNYANGRYYGEKCTYDYSPYSDGRAWCYIGGHSCSERLYDSGSDTIYIGYYSGTGWDYSYLGCNQQVQPPGNLSLSYPIYQKKMTPKTCF